MNWVTGLFESAGMTAHGFCLAWDPELMALHVMSDALIGLSYYSIPVCLALLVIRRSDLAFRSTFWMFVTFIMACGTTHLFAIWTLWEPDYLAEGAVKAVTAVFSVMTAAQLWPMLPRLIALPSQSALTTANEQLQREIAERDSVMRALRRETAERERAEEMLRQSQKLEAVGQLTGGIAHDFNNLLASIMANLELLEQRCGSDPELTRFIGRAVRSVSRGGALTQQLLAFSRRQTLSPEALSPARLVEGMSELLRTSLGGTISLDVRGPADLWLVEADPHQLENAILNLALNARDAMPDGGALTVTMRNTVAAQPGVSVEGGSVDDMEPGEYVAIEVADTGRGMTPEIRASAFEPFFTTKPVGQGTGLGLSQVYGFVKQSKGHVSLESEVGRGTRITLFLRRAMSDTAALTG
jgi:signal transduction histidine kinase